MKTKSLFQWTIGVLVLAVLFAAPLGSLASPEDAFVGNWRTIDTDDGNMRLTIAGPPGGPYRITWTDSYLTSCEGGPGVIRGEGNLHPLNPHILQASLRLYCFQLGVSYDFDALWTYYPDFDMLSMRDPSGIVLLWTRPSNPIVDPVFAMIVGSAEGDWFWTSGFAGNTDLRVRFFSSQDRSEPPLWEGLRTADEYGFISIEPGDHGLDLQHGNLVVVDDGVTEKSLLLETISIDVFDTGLNQVAGTAPPGRFVYLVASESPEPGDQHSIDLVSDPTTGEWFADFGSLGFDLTDDMRPWSFAQIFDIDGDANEAGPPSAPYLIAFPEVDEVFGYGWEEGSQVALAVNGAVIQEATVSPAPWDENDILAYFSFGGQYDLTASDVVVLSGSGLEVRHIVSNLSVTEIDLMADTVSGIADDGEVVHSIVFEFDGSNIESIAVADEWLADFGSLGFDLTEGICGRAEIYDALGSSTVVDWCIPNPRMTVFPESEYFQGYDWPDGAIVAIDVGGKPACSLDRESWDSFFDGNFPEGCDLVSGDTVTFTDSATTRTHVVRSLAITHVDMDADSVAGTADIGEVVVVGGYDFGGEFEQVLTVEDGSWLAEFGSTGIDLVEGMCGYARIFDEVGNWTQVDWCVPRPHLTVYLEWQLIEGWEWPVGALVQLSIDDPATGEGPDHEMEAVVAAADWGPTASTVGFDLNGLYTVKAGDIVTLSGGSISRTHVVRSLSVISADANSNIVRGTADPGASVHVFPHDPSEPWEVLTADDAGQWQVDFSESFDLLPGSTGAALIIDENGNATEVGWTAVDPAAALWLAYFTADVPPGTWHEGDHSYHFDWLYTEPGPGLAGSSPQVEFAVVSGAPTYDGFILLTTFNVQARISDACQTIAEIDADQPTRFRWGWLTDWEMTYEEALAHFLSFEVQAVSASLPGGPVQLQLVEVVALASVDQPSYACSFALK